MRWWIKSLSGVFLWWGFKVLQQAAAERALQRRSLVSARASGRVFGGHFESDTTLPPLCAQLSLNVQGKLGEDVQIYVRRNVRTGRCMLCSPDLTVALHDEVISAGLGWSQVTVMSQSPHWIFLEAGHELRLDVLWQSSEHLQVYVRGKGGNAAGSYGIWCGIRAFWNRRHGGIGSEWLLEIWRQQRRWLFIVLGVHCRTQSFRSCDAHRSITHTMCRDVSV